MKKTLFALAVLSSTSLPVLAANVDVIVTGTVKSAACTLDLPASKTIDYGKIDPSLLSGTDYTLLPERQIDITLNCDAPAKMALSVANQRPGSLAGVTTEGLGGTGKLPVNVFGEKDIVGAGLGMDGTDKIGGYAVRLVQGTVTVDTAKAEVISRYSVAGTAWNKSVTGSIYEMTAGHQVSWATPGQVSPLAFQVMVGKIGVQAYINKKSELDISKEIKLDGFTTIEAIYL